MKDSKFLKNSDLGFAKIPNMMHLFVNRFDMAAMVYMNNSGAGNHTGEWQAGNDYNSCGLTNLELVLVPCFG